MYYLTIYDVLFDNAFSLFSEAVVVVDADEATGEGQYLAKGDEYAAVNHTNGWNADTGNQQSTPEDTQDDRKE